MKEFNITKGGDSYINLKIDMNEMCKLTELT
jgi:hypothetical protein